MDSVPTIASTSPAWVHTLDAAETITRIISAFPEHARKQARGIGSTSDARWDGFGSSEEKVETSNGAESITIDRF